MNEETYYDIRKSRSKNDKIYRRECKKCSNIIRENNLKGVYKTLYMVPYQNFQSEYNPLVCAKKIIEELELEGYTVYYHKPLTLIVITPQESQISEDDDVDMTEILNFLSHRSFKNDTLKEKN